jgi:hypothetical protein
MRVLLIGFTFYLCFAAHSEPIEFEHQVETCVESELIWQALETAMISSKQSWLWPDDASQVKGEGLHQDAKIRVTYGSGWFAPTYGYLLSEVTYGVSMTYQADSEHPFVGGATISMLQTESGTTVLDWSGNYRNANAFQRNYFRRFASQFFARLDENIQLAEPSLCQSL